MENLDIKKIKEELAFHRKKIKELLIIINNSKSTILDISDQFDNISSILGYGEKDKIDILSERRNKKYVEKRWLMIYILRELDYEWQEIADFLGKRYHSTISYAYDSFIDLSLDSANKEYNDKLKADEIIKTIKSRV